MPKIDDGPRLPDLAPLGGGHGCSLHNICGVTLRPTARAIVFAALRGGAFAVTGLLLIYAAWSSGVVVPAIVGTPALVLGVVIFVNSAVARIDLDSGLLSARTLLGGGQVRIEQITKILPINIGYRRTPFTPWNRSARMFEVWTEKGPVPFWLNPNVYGEEAIQNLIRKLPVTPEAKVHERVLEPFSRNRSMGSRQ